MKLQILESAFRDIEEGITFYEMQERGLGDYFLASISADVESLRIYAGIHPVSFKDYHRLLCRAFPFAVFYLKEQEIVTVFAVTDCRRDPTWIRQRLEE